MKLVKKMLAITFTFMMIVGMGTNVKAMEGSQTDTKGTITVSNVLEGHTYKLYKILNLESYSYESGKAEEGNYAYTLAGNAWDDFVKTNSGEGNFFTITDNKYVTFNEGEAATLAKEAIKFAEDNNLGFITTSTKDSAGNFVFSDLDLGYYLVDSSVGALCNLTTTNPTVTIQEKNGMPTVVKQVKEDSTNVFDSSNTADIGQTVEFQTTITAQAGAHNYVLHDKMSEGLTFDSDNVTVVLKKNSEAQVTTLASPKDYVLKTAELGETDSICTFHIEFTEEFCNSLNADDQIIVSYSATLNENAVIGVSGNKNDTWLKYGDGTDTAHSSTLTKTFEIPVFKYTGAEKKGLGKAKFTLKNANGSDSIKFVKVSDATEDTELTYRVAKTGEENTVTEITTPSSGKFTIQGLDADTYHLTEKEQPKGYNKLATPITVIIETDGKIKIDTSYVNVVEVENKTGTILPSTGGMGTTIIYMVGAILVIGSGIVLLSKKKSKEK
mgnify:CR=1 FL=1